MKRSLINQTMRKAEALFERENFHLPPFAFWTPRDWEDKGPAYDEIRDNLLGWDITDYGQGDFEKVGLLSFMIRNGNPDDPRYVKPYCEKVLMQEDGQVTPYHFHFNKIEDIINRGGGNLMIQLYNSTRDGEFADTDVEVLSDGKRETAKPGVVVKLLPGQSITLMNGVYHQFWAEAGHGPVVIGEVSKTCDDKSDNRFLVESQRFPHIEEDEVPLHYMCTEYP